MSPEVAAALYGALAGGIVAITGVLAGMFAERRLRGRRKVRCVIWGWRTTVREAGPLSRAVCSFEVDLFNERPSPTGLRSVSVALLRDGEQWVVTRLRAADSDEELGVLNLPPQQWVHAGLYAFFEGEGAQELVNFRRADFVGYFPDGGTFRRKIAERKDYARPRWRKLFG
jgi:hypothetical protein